MWDKSIEELRDYADILDVPYNAKSRAKSYVIEDLITQHSAKDIKDVISGKVGYDIPSVGPVSKGYMIGQFVEDEYNIYDVRKATILKDGDVELELWVYPYGEGYPQASLPVTFTYPQFKLLEAGRAVKAFSKFDPMSATEEDVDGELLEMVRSEYKRRISGKAPVPPAAGDTPKGREACSAKGREKSGKDRTQKESHHKGDRRADAVW